MYMIHSDTKDTSPKEQQLFHYKDKPEYFYDMLHNGIWPRYCEEDFTWLVGTGKIIAFPVVCFCDIPLSAAETHRSTYGDFAVSISKCLAGTFDISPMWYLQEGSTITSHVASQVKESVRFSLEAIGKGFRPLLPFLKPTIGFQADRNVGKPTTEVKVFEEEMEWRHSPHQLSNSWVESDSSGFIKPNDKIHDLSNGFRLKLRADQIEDVIVPNAEHFENVRREFSDLAGKVRIWGEMPGDVSESSE